MNGSVAMRNAIIAVIAMLLAAAPEAANAQIGAGSGAGSGAVIAVPPGATGGTAGAAMGSTRPYYRDNAYRDRVCWHDRGYRHCRWR